MKEIEEFLKVKKFPGKLIFSKVSGSRSHNTDIASSDWDFAGVYVQPTNDYLGLKHHPETVENTTEKPDHAFHEVGKFCRLLLVGNPTIIECLFTEKMFLSEPEWDVLKVNAKKFLSKDCVKQYLGYAEGQLRRLKNGNNLSTKGGRYSEKFAYHFSRLLIDALDVVNGIIPEIWKETGTEDHTYLMDIRHGKIGEEGVVHRANIMIEHLKSKMDSCKLPDKGDKEFLHSWLVDVRSNYYK